MGILEKRHGIILIICLILIAPSACRRNQDMKENIRYHDKYYRLLHDTYHSYGIQADTHMGVKVFRTPDSSITVWDHTNSNGQRIFTLLSSQGDALALIYSQDTLHSAIHYKGGTGIMTSEASGYVSEIKPQLIKPVFRYNLLNNILDFCFLDPDSPMYLRPKGPLFFFGPDKVIDSVLFFRNGILSDAVLTFPKNQPYAWRLPQ